MLQFSGMRQLENDQNGAIESTFNVAVRFLAERENRFKQGGECSVFRGDIHGASGHGETLHEPVNAAWRFSIGHQLEWRTAKVADGAR